MNSQHTKKVLLASNLNFKEDSETLRLNILKSSMEHFRVICCRGDWGGWRVLQNRKKILFSFTKKRLTKFFVTCFGESIHFYSRSDFFFSFSREG
jgi:hypothetical protein